jgi:hypothetical protein
MTRETTDKQITIVLGLIALSFSASHVLGGQGPRTFMGHLLGETYQQTMDIVKLVPNMSVSDAGKCDSSLEAPPFCNPGISDEINIRFESWPPGNSHPGHATFDFVEGKLNKIRVDGCASGISQVRLLEKKFGKYSAVTDMPFRNTTGSLGFDKEWDWEFSNGERLYVLESIDADCGGYVATVIFERPLKRKKAVNPY